MTEPITLDLAFSRHVETCRVCDDTWLCPYGEHLLEAQWDQELEKK